MEVPNKTALTKKIDHGPEEAEEWRQVALSKWRHYRDNVWPSNNDIAQRFHAHSLAKTIPYLLGVPEEALDESTASSCPSCAPGYNCERGIYEPAKTRYYLAGPMSGYPEHNFPAFAKAAYEIRKLGVNLVSAHEIDHGHHTVAERGTKPHGEYMRTDLKVLLECDGIILLPSWTASKGALIELSTALSCGMSVYLYNYDEHGQGNLVPLTERGNDASL